MSNVPATPADGNFAVWVVPTIADPKAPTVTELSAASRVDISCYITAGGYTDTLEQAAIADERLCDTFVAELPGRVTPSVEITFIDNTNSPLETTHNEAVEALEAGADYWIASRRGIAFDSLPTADQKVNLRRVIGGVHNPLPPEANSVTRSSAKQFVQAISQGVKIVAP